MECSLPGSSVHGIFQARVLEWGAIAFSVYTCICAQSCPTLYSPIDCSSRGSSAYGIFQATILKWGAISYSRGSSQLRDWTHVSRLLHWQVWFFMTSATWEALDLTQELAKSQVLRANTSGKDLLVTWDQWEKDLDVSVVEERLMEASLKVGQEVINLLWEYKQLQGVERGLKSCTKRKYKFQQLMESECWEVVDEECQENHINSCCLLCFLFFFCFFV